MEVELLQEVTVQLKVITVQLDWIQAEIVVVLALLLGKFIIACFTS